MNLDFKINEMKQNIIENAICGIRISRDAFLHGALGGDRAIARMFVLSMMLEWEHFLGNISREEIKNLNIEVRGALGLNPSYWFDNSNFKDKDILNVVFSVVSSKNNVPFGPELNDLTDYSCIGLRIYNDHIIMPIWLSQQAYDTPYFLQERYISSSRRNDIDAEYTNLEFKDSNVKESFALLMQHPSFFNFVKLLQYSDLNKEDPYDLKLHEENSNRLYLYSNVKIQRKFIELDGRKYSWPGPNALSNEDDNKSKTTPSYYGQQNPAVTKIVSTIKLPVSSIDRESTKNILSFLNDCDKLVKSHSMIADQCALQMQVFKMTDSSYLKYTFDIEEMESKLKELTVELNKTKQSHKNMLYAAKKSINGKVTRAVNKELSLDKNKFSDSKKTLTNIIKIY